VTRDQLDGRCPIPASPRCAFEREDVRRVAHDFTVASGAYRPVLADIAENRGGAQRSNRRQLDRLVGRRSKRKRMSVELQQLGRAAPSRPHEAAPFVTIQYHLREHPSRSAALDFQKKRLEIRGWQALKHAGQVLDARCPLNAPKEALVHEPSIRSSASPSRLGQVRANAS
jgi:hypothetical protein